VDFCSHLIESAILRAKHISFREAGPRASSFRIRRRKQLRPLLERFEAEASAFARRPRQTDDTGLPMELSRMAWTLIGGPTGGILFARCVRIRGWLGHADKRNDLVQSEVIRASSGRTVFRCLLYRAPALKTATGFGPLISGTGCLD